VSCALIVTADDFGMSLEVNEAVEEAHRRGILTCASLVVTGEAAEDAVRRARRMPELGVGLHLALLAAPPASPPDAVPALMHPGGGLGFAPGLTGMRIALSGAVREQVRRETRAQLNLFRRTGLPLDHLDGHWHFHQHPWILGIVVGLAAEYGIRAVRVPYEPAFPSWRAAGRRSLPRRIGMAGAHRLLAAHMRRRLRAAGIAANDWFFGMYDGGALDAGYLLRLIADPLPGITEIGLHPATRRWSGPHAPPGDWRAEDELAALIDPRLREACRSGPARLIRFADLAPGTRVLAA